MIDICDKIMEKIAIHYGIGFKESDPEDFMAWLETPAKRSERFSEEGIDVFIGRTIYKRLVIMIDFVAYGEWYTYYFTEKEEV